MKIKINILGGIEKAGNALPHPAALFGIFGLMTLVISLIGYYLQWEGINPSNGETIRIINLLSRDGLHKILLGMVKSYTGFAPLGIVMVAMLGIGIAESSGLIKSSINLLLIKAPKNSVTFLIVFTGILSNMASDLGYILIIPIAGVIFHSLGRHPIAGMAAAFAGVSGGFSANLFIGTIDPLLAGLSTEAARIVDPDYYVMTTANYYFMVASTFIIAFAGTWVTKAIVEPRLGKYTGGVEKEEITKLNKREKKGLKWAGIVLLLFIAIIAFGLIPSNGILRADDNTILHSPVLKGFIAVLFIVAGTCGIVYGYISGTFKKHEDVINGMNDSFKGLIAFLVLVFFASQFVAWFKWSNLGIMVAVKGATLLQSADFGLIPLVIMFIIISGTINMFMGSASAKWAIMGPIFIPMFMLLGYSPELSQAVYRIGDSVTNLISPMMSFFALIIVYFEKYDSKSGIGSLIATMMPYSIAFFIVWTILMIIWIMFGFPLGPEAGLYYVK
ncbi:MAG: TIGR00366 family protein [Bacteroidetes bacterium]|jgi:aminobenzoyl-glutamate transport protein|nr:TIGR00366 family protein [Bacteroidota bacterium]MBT6687635.1 TIGR00366 family protein [Bacteroidota bacterium]MBT7144776.1 TIGR00366 family protein [Bacteroidota bacterium]MBT7491403.1 TIGR00366 family protein [Bacteroidota bacterium]